IFHHAITSGHRATESAADANVRFSSASLAQHRIKRDQLENVDWLEPELLRDPGHSVIVNEAEVFLPKVEQRQRRTPLVIARISRDRFIHFSLQLGRNVCARRVHTKNQLVNVLCFSTTLSSLKMIVTVSLS